MPKTPETLCCHVAVADIDTIADTAFRAMIHVEAHHDIAWTEAITYLFSALESARTIVSHERAAHNWEHTPVDDFEPYDSMTNEPRT